MKNTAKRWARSGIRRAVALMAWTSLGRLVLDWIVAAATTRMELVRHRNVALKFVVPNRLNHFRVQSFSTKEPETLQWIDNIPHGAVVWDVGANVGLYSCYAAAARGCRVFAFEPSVFNLELLARNVFVNDLTGQVTLVPLPLSNELAVNRLRMSSMEWGGALSTFGQDYGHDGKALQNVFEFGTIGITMVDAVTRLGIAQPDYLKIDVDGIEHLILQGGAAILARVHGVLIEINDEFREQALECARSLQAAGLVQVAKGHSELVKGEFAATFNQIWVRAPAHRADEAVTQT